MAETFTFFENFGEVCACLEEEDRKELMYAICMYGAYGEEVELPYLLKAVFISLKESIDYSKTARTQGAKGAKKRWAKKAEAPEQEAEPAEGVPLGDAEHTPLQDETIGGHVGGYVESPEKSDGQNNTRQDSTGHKDHKPDARVREIVRILNEETGKAYKPTTPKTASLIRARLKEGFAVEDFRRVIETKTREWRGGEMEKYLRPETLFGTKFESYLNQGKRYERRDYAEYDAD